MDFVRQHLSQVNRIVVKVGTHLLEGMDQGLNLKLIDHLAYQFGQAKKQKKELILVSSGAVGAGAFMLGLREPPEELSKRQGLAAIGQSRLMHQYEQAFGRHDQTVAQMLLTRDTFDSRDLYLNTRNTLETLLRWDVVPIINENDTVSVDELKFGDNDELSALVAGKIGADLLILMTDVDGLYDRPPDEPGAQRIPLVPKNKNLDLKVDEETGSRFGLGGMTSKLRAISLASETGILTHICNGNNENIILRILSGKANGTWFQPRGKKLSARKRWIAARKTLADGEISIDTGAEEALCNGGNSLLPSGVTKVSGDFEKGDVIHVIGIHSEPIARGLVRFSAKELRSIQGKKSSEISQILGHRQGYAVIHRDDMLVFSGKKEL